MTTSPSPASIRRTLTMRRKSYLQTLFLHDWELITRRRLTIEEMRSPEWQALREQFVKLFESLYEIERKTNGNR